MPLDVGRASRPSLYNGKTGERRFRSFRRNDPTKCRNHMPGRVSSPACGEASRTDQRPRRAGRPFHSVRIQSPLTMPQATNELEQGRNLRIAKIGVSRHCRTLADCLTTMFNYRFDATIRNTFLPIWISEITRIRA
jgi:hypothetical protein